MDYVSKFYEESRTKVYLLKYLGRTDGPIISNTSTIVSSIAFARKVIAIRVQWAVSNHLALERGRVCHEHMGVSAGSKAHCQAESRSFGEEHVCGVLRVWLRRLGLLYAWSEASWNAKVRRSQREGVRNVGMKDPLDSRLD
jgi:hypothetical protein